MNLNQLLDLLSNSPDQYMNFMFLDKSFIPSHYHITEVGKIQKEFIDCGGTLRKDCCCVLQAWAADDVDHRLTTNKLLEILKLGNEKLNLEEFPVEIEYENELISQYKINDFEKTPSGLLFYLEQKHTDCLAKDKCLPKKGCCGGSGCC
jgi:hypothetical protein